MIEAPDVSELRDRVERRADRGGQKRKPALKSQAWAKYHLPGHDLIGSAAWNQEYLDSAANYSTVPMAMSLDAVSKDRPDGIQYRLGVHKVCVAAGFSSSFCRAALQLACRMSVHAIFLHIWWPLHC